MKLSSVFSLAALLLTCVIANADISLSNYSIYTQDFDTLASTGATSTLMPTDWSFSEAGISANTTYGVGTGSSGTANTYSYGILGTNPLAERALGELTAAALQSTFGAEFQNTGNTNMTKIKAISYRGEQWRLGATGRVDALDFQYSVNATSLTTGTWTNVNALDFIAPVTTGIVGAKDGNAVGFNTTLSISGPPNTGFVFSTPVAPGGTFWIRWVPRDATGADDGLGIDNFSIQAIPEPSSIALCGLLFGVMGFSLVRRRKKVAG